MSSARELLGVMVQCARTETDPSGYKKASVPKNLIDMARDLLRGPTPEGKRYLRNLKRAKYYCPPLSSRKWLIVKREQTEDDYLLLCRSGLDYVVFRFWLPHIGPKMQPEDKFAYGRASGESLFREMCQ